jgi:glycosyltransferase involved in cell wall biosynthesis
MILLSICIPTYNRSNYLKQTVESIICQELFINSDEVEVVISDNCSEDSTESIAKEFIQLHPNKIIYFKNSKNLSDKNFQLALSRGRGQYLKLNNDYLKHINNSLEVILKLIKSNLVEKPNIYFMSGAIGNKDKLKGYGKDQFLQLTSHYSTWIGIFGIWKTDFELIEDFNRCSKLQMCQLDGIYQSLSKNKNFLLVDTLIFSASSMIPRRNYDLLSIFLDNYLKVLLLHTDEFGINPQTFLNERKRVLLNFVCGWAARSSHGLEASFVVEKHWNRIWRYCEWNLILFIHYTLKYLKNWSIFWIEKNSYKINRFLKHFEK